MCIFQSFQKIRKNYTVGPIFRRGTWEYQRMTCGAPEGATPLAGAAKGVAAPPCGVGSPLPHSAISSSQHLLSPEKNSYQVHLSRVFAPELQISRSLCSAQISV